MKHTFAFTLAVLLFAAVPAMAQEQWSQFRGPNAQGISKATGLPIQWNATENIAWKTAIPGDGWSSPIIWDDRIFLTTATDGGRECRIIAVNRNNGEILWNTMVFTQELRRQHGRNSHATPTPVTDGERVYALFANGAFAAVDFEGNVVWTNTELDGFSSQHGMSTSPILYGDLLIASISPTQGNQGFMVPWDRAFLLALDKNTGVERWRTSRGMSRIGHSVPVVIQVNGQDQIVSMTGDVIQGFNPANGELVWTVRDSGEPAVATPAVAEGMVFTSTRLSQPILGIRTDGRGDVTETHVLWRQPDNSPMVSSFLYVSPILYSAHEGGTFAAHDATTGEILWRVRLTGGRPDASPLYADGKIYLTTHEGVTTVLRLNADPRLPAEVIAVNDIGATVQASIAVSGGRLYLRTERELWCIGR